MHSRLAKKGRKMGTSTPKANDILGISNILVLFSSPPTPFFSLLETPQDPGERASEIGRDSTPILAQVPSVLQVHFFLLFFIGGGASCACAKSNIITKKKEKYEILRKKYDSSFTPCDKSMLLHVLALFCFGAVLESASGIRFM